MTIILIFMRLCYIMGKFFVLKNNFERITKKMNKTERFRKVLEEVSNSRHEKPDLPLESIINKAMDRYGVPDSGDTRAGYRFAILRKLEKEKIRKPEIKETAPRKKPLSKSLAEEKETELSLDDEFTEGILDGNISREDLKNSHYKYREIKKPRDFYFGPPR